MVLFFECYPSLEQSSVFASHLAVLHIILGLASFSTATLKTFLSHIGEGVGWG